MLAAPMDVVCEGPWRAGTLLWQPKAGAWALTIACHAVFELTPGESRVLTRPLEAPTEGEGDERWLVEPWGASARRPRRGPRWSWSRARVRAGRVPG